MTENYQIDNVDLQILEQLQENARKPYLEIARDLLVSGGTIHQRVDRLKEMGIIKGSQIQIDYKRLGVGVKVLLGVHLSHARAVESVIEKLSKLPEIIEIEYTTGNYALFVKIFTKDIDSFHQLLVKKIQPIEEIRSTESFICLKTPLLRPLNLEVINK